MLSKYLVLPPLKARVNSANEGFLIIELLVAFGLFVFGVSSLGYLILGSNIGSRQGVERSKAVLLAQEGIEAARSIRDSGFSNLTIGDHGLRLSPLNQWEFFGTSDFTDTYYERVVSVESVGPARRKATSKVTWQFSGARLNTVEVISYLVDFVQRLIFDISQTDFLALSRNSLQATSDIDGEVKLAFLGNWTNATVFATSAVDGLGANDIDVSNPSALYVATNNSASGEEFTVFDISNISGLEAGNTPGTGVIPEIGSVEIASNVNAVSVYRGYAYLATDDSAGELKVVRLSDYTIVNSYNTPTAALAIATTNNVAYVGTSINGSGSEFYALNISSPESPLPQLGSTEIASNVFGIAASASRAYLATAHDSKELFVLDLSSFSELVSSTQDLAGTADATAVFVDGSVVYISRLNSADPEFYIFNLPLMTLAGRAEVSGNVNDVSINNARAYLATSLDDRELVVLDLTACLPLCPEAGFADLNTASDASAVYFLGAYVYLATANDLLEISAVKGGNTGGAVTPALASSLNTFNIYNANDVFIRDNYAYLVTDDNTNVNEAEFYLIDITDPNNPQSLPLQRLNIGASVNSVYVEGNYAYLATSDDAKELLVVDVTDKNNPSVINTGACTGGNGCYNVLGTADGLAVFAKNIGGVTYVYLGVKNSASEEFYVLNAANPLAISLANDPNSKFEAGADVNDIRVNSDGTNAYLATANPAEEVMLLDLTNLAAIARAYFYDTAGTALGLAYDGTSKVYVASEDAAASADLYELAVTGGGGPTEDWSSPTLTSFYNTGDAANANAVFIENNYAYLAFDASGAAQFEIVDIADPATPQPVSGSTLSLGSTVNDIYVAGSYAFLATADDSRELIAVNVAIPSSPSLVTEYNADESWDGLSVFAMTTTPNIITVYLGTQLNSGPPTDREFYLLEFDTVSNVFTFKDSYNAEANVYDIKIRPSGGFAYLATGFATKEFIILNVSNPLDIQEADSYDLPANAKGVDYNSGNAYVVTDNSSIANDFYVMDVTAGGALEETWSPSSLKSSYDAISSANAKTIFAAGNYAFLGLESGGDKQFHIIDIGNPNNPVAPPSQSSLVLGSDDVNDVFAEGNYAFLATAEDTMELQVVDIASANRVAEFNADEALDGLSVFAITTAPNIITVYLGTKKNGGSGDAEFYVLKFDTSTTEFTTPPGVPLGSFNLDGNINDIYASVDAASTFAYLATSRNSGEFVILDASNVLDIQEIDSYDTPGDIDATGLDYDPGAQYIHLTTLNNGAAEDFFVLDVKTGGAPAPSWVNPTLNGFYDTAADPTNANAVFVSGNYAYLVTAEGGDKQFHVVNISNPSNPSIEGTAGIAGDVNDIYVLENFAFLATSDDGKELVVMNVSAKNSPNKVLELDVEDNSDGLAIFATSGAPPPYDAIVYLGTRNNGGPPPSNREFYIYYYDFENTGNITLASVGPPSTYDVGTHVYDIYMQGSYAYLATNNSAREIVALNISNPASITEAWSDDTAGSAGARGIYYASDTVYLVTNNDTTNPDFFAYDVSAGLPPPPPQSLDLNTDNTGVAVASGKAFVSTRTSSEGLTVVDLATFAELGTFNTQARAAGLITNGDYVYLATEHDTKELEIVQAGTVFSPFIAEVGKRNLNSDNTNVSIFGVRAFVSTRSDPQLRILNINPADIGTVSYLGDVGSFSAGATANDVFFYNGFAYLATEHDSAEMQIVQPGSTAPSDLIASVYSANLNSDNNDVFFGNNFAFVATELAQEGGAGPFYGLTIVDVSAPATSLPEVGHFDTGSLGHSNGVFRNGNYVYIANENDSRELQIIEPSTAPGGGFTFNYIQSANLGSDNTDVFLSGSNAYISTRTSAEQMTVVRLSDFIELHHFDTIDSANALWYAGNYVYLANNKDDMELQILEFAPTAGGGSYAQAGWLTSSSYDSGSGLTLWEAISWSPGGVGELKFKLRTASTVAGLTTATWIGRDGTENTFYTVPGGETIVTDPGASGVRWLQYKGYFSGNLVDTPILDDITITYD